MSGASDHVTLKSATRGAAILVISLFIGLVGNARAENTPAWGWPAGERGPKTLYEWIVGSGAEDKHEGKPNEQDDREKDSFGIELLIANNYVQDDLQNKGLQVASGLTGVFQLTKKLEAFVEWDAFYPTGPISSLGPQHYAVGGLVYFITNNFAVDVRAGMGLNDHSNRFLAGAGFTARF
jgi:hypothetical protein